MIEESTGIKPELTKHPIISVSRGATIAGLSNQTKIDEEEVTNYSVEIETISFGLPFVETIIRRNTKLPYKGEYEFKINEDIKGRK